MTASLRHNRDFVLFASGQGLAMLGSSAAGIALPLIVLAAGETALAVASVSAVTTGVLAATCLPAGAYVDRHNRRRILLTCDALRLLSAVAVALAVVARWTPLSLFLAVALIAGALSAAATAASSAALRHVVSDGQLPDAISVNVVRGRIALLAGPLIGGGLFAIAPAAPFWFYAVTLVASITTLLLVRAPLSTTTAARSTRLVADITAGLRLFWRDDYLRWSLLICSAQNLLLSGTFLGIVVVVGLQSGSGLSLGVVTAINGAGALLGGLLVPVARKHIRSRTALVGGSAVCAILVLPMALTQQALALAVLIAGCSFAIAISGTLLTAERMLRTPKNMQGRMSSATGLLFMATPPIGTLLAGTLMDNAPSAVTFIVFGLLTIVLAVASGRISAPDVESTAPTADVEGIQGTTRTA